MRLIDTIAETQRGLADALPVLVMLSDPDGVVNYFNRAWHEYTGQARFDRDVTEEWRNYIHPADVPMVGAAWYAAMESGSDVEIQYRIHHAASGEWRWFSAHARALRDASGKLVQWIGTAMEIHEARQAKDALETLYRHQHQVAESFQRAALPQALPSPHVGMQFDAVYRPSSKDLLVGGDWYDAFMLPNGAIAFSVGDVTGHGIEAAVLMSKLRQSFRAITIRAAQFQNRDPGSIVASVEEMMLMENSDLIASAFFGIVDAERHTLDFSNAGHPPPLLRRRNGSIEELRNGDALLGLSPDARRTSASVALSDATMLVCYTDGLIEASHSLFEGEARLRNAIEAWPTRTTSPASALLTEVVQGPAADDIAIFTITFT
jgi:PAS domain S-box-containing protein